MSAAIEMDIAKLDALLRSLGKNVPVARVGILGKNPTRTGTSKTNAEIGAKHEFGLDGMPVRSFLRVPIADNMQKYLDEANLSEKKIIDSVIRENSFEPLVAKFAVVGEAIVADAFASGGFGKWKPSNMAHKKNQQTLVETQQLRNSISSEVK